MHIYNWLDHEWMWNEITYIYWSEYENTGIIYEQNEYESKR